MKYFTIASLFLVAVLVVGCSAPITKESVRQDSAYKTSFVVSQPYQQVFDVLLKRSQACYLDRPNSKQLTLVGNRDNGKKTANIVLEYVYAMAEHDVILLVDIRAQQDAQTLPAKTQAAKTQVNVYASRKGDVKKADVFEKWLADPRGQVGCA